jgi:hypothetical protein
VPVLVAVDEPETQHAPGQSAVPELVLRRDLAGGIGEGRRCRVVLAGGVRKVVVVDQTGAGLVRILRRRSSRRSSLKRGMPPA